ncbi:MAG TPA: glycosyltransferase family A protein [Mycobacteriales bacterium]
MKTSVIIPTWQRRDVLLQRAIPSVWEQTVPVEIVVASDGPDPELRELVAGLNVVYVEVDQHYDDAVNVGARARNRGLEVASGDLIAYLDDDNAFRPQHVERLADALAAHPDRDFAYSRMFRHGLGDEIGAEPPEHGRVDSSIIMQRRDTHLKFGWWPVPSEYCVDWQLVQAWVLAGASWVFVPEVTVDYYYTPRS